MYLDQSIDGSGEPANQARTSLFKDAAPEAWRLAVEYNGKRKSSAKRLTLAISLATLQDDESSDALKSDQGLAEATGRHRPLMSALGH